MSARGILQNPAMFSGYSLTPRECVEEWLSIALSSNLYFLTFHHHLVFMLEKVLPKELRRTFNNLNSYQKVLDFLNDFFQFDFQYCPTSAVREGLWNEVPEKSGKFFLEKTEPELFLNDLFVTN